jgi:hypothetical protein
VVECARRHVAEIATNRWNVAALVRHELLRMAQPLGCHQPRAATFAATSTCGREAIADPLADDVAIHLCKCRMDLEEGVAGRCRGIEEGVERAKADATTRNLIDEADELSGSAAEVVKLRNDQHIATPQCIETGSEAWSLGAPATRAIVEHPLTARGCQSFDMEIEDLPSFARGSSRIANYRHVKSLG